MLRAVMMDFFSPGTITQPRSKLMTTAIPVVRHPPTDNTMSHQRVRMNVSSRVTRCLTLQKAGHQNPAKKFNLRTCGKVKLASDPALFATSWQASCSAAQRHWHSAAST